MQDFKFNSETALSFIFRSQFAGASRNVCEGFGSVHETFHELNQRWCQWQVAQVLSVRPEAVPEEYRNEFRKIQP